MADINDRYTVQEKLEIVLMHVSGLSQWQTAKEFHYHLLKWLLVYHTCPHTIDLKENIQAATTDITPQVM